MSSESREYIKKSGELLQTAEEYLHTAGERAKTGGDGALVKQIEKIKTDVSTVRESVQKKLGHENG